jgi:hypothetical protein
VLASFLVLIVLDGSKLPKTALSEKFNLLLKEPSQLASMLLTSGVMGSRAGAEKSERTEADPPQNGGRASVSRVPPFSRVMIIASFFFSMRNCPASNSVAA